MNNNKTPMWFLDRLKGCAGALQELFGSADSPSFRRERRLAPLQELEDRRLLSATPIGPEIKVNTTTAGTQQTTASTPKSIAVAPNGDFVAVWASNPQDGSGWGVYAQRFNASGTPQGAEFRVNTTTANDQHTPAVAADAGGNFVVTWSSRQSGNWDTYAQRYAANGTALGSEFLVNTNTPNDQLNSSIAMGPSGNFVITWASNGQDGSNWGIFGQRFNAAGVPQGSEFQVNTYTSGPQTDSQVAMDASGNFAITWTSNGQDGNNEGVFAQRFNTAGAKLGTEFQVNTYTSKEQNQSDIAMDASGNFVITWSSQDQDGDTYGVYAQRYNATGAAVGAEFRVNNNTQKEQQYSSLAMDGSGNFTITWSSKGQEPSGDTFGIYARRYLTSGVPDGGEFRVNSTTNNDQIFSSIGMSPSGSFVILWSGTGPGDGSGVFARQYVTAGISVTPTSGLVTSEDGASAVFSVILATQPNADVTVGISSSNPAEGILSVSSLTFTNANWNIAQTVTVTGQDDALLDGPIAYSVITAPAASADPAYNNLNAANVTLTNMDNENPGITVNPVSGLVTTEAGGSATFAIVLNTAPTGNVVIGLTSSNPAEGTVSISSVTFTPADWNLAQTITVTGVDDAVDDGDLAFTILTAPAVSSDPSYNGLDAPNVAVTNLNDDVAGIAVTPTTGLVTTEAGGQASFNVVLSSQPTANVTLMLNSSNPTEGTISTATLTFTSANWNMAQTVTITGVDDPVVDGDVAYSVVINSATSADAGYNGLDPSDVDVVNQNDDTSLVIVTPVSGLTTTEAGGAASFTVQLSSAPLLPVTIGISSSNPAEGTVSTSSLAFTLVNWNIPQTVTVTGVDDFVADGDQIYTIIVAPATGLDLVYNGADGPDVTVTNLDNDFTGINVSALSGSTSEAGGTATFNVVLNSQPSANVSIGISSSNPAEGTVSTSNLIFTPGNWNVAQIVTVTGVDDFVMDGNIAYTIVTAPAVSADLSYNGLNSTDVNATNTDNDTAAINVAPTGGLITTPGGNASFTVALNSQPTANVTITLASSDPAAGDATQASVIFTAADWNAPQTITVSSPSSVGAPGDYNYAIHVGPVLSADAAYNAQSGSDVMLTLHVAAAAPMPPAPAPPAVPAATPVLTGAISLILASTASSTTTATGSAVATPTPTSSVSFTSALLLNALTPSAAANTVPMDAMGANAVPSSAEANARRTALFLPASRSNWEEIQLSREPIMSEPLPETFALRVAAISTLASPSSTASGDAGFDVLNEFGERTPWTEPGIETTMAVGTGIIAAGGYVLLNSRVGFWLLGLLTSRPLWKQFDPLEVLYAWEEDEKRLVEEDEEETLLSLVD